MDIKMFFEFPGVLILIGIILLILSIVIGLLAYRKVDKEEIVFSINEEDDKTLEEIDNTQNVNEVTIIDEPNLVESNMLEENEELKEIVKEEQEENEVSLEKKEDIPVIIEKQEIPVFDEEVEKLETIDKVKIYGGNNPKINTTIENKEKTIYGEKEDIEVL